MKGLGTVGFCATAFVLGTAMAGAQVVHAGGGIGGVVGGSASIGMPGASISTGASTGINTNVLGPGTSTNANANSNLGANAALNQNNPSATAALNAALAGSATVVQSMGSGTVTLLVSAPSGKQSVTIAVPRQVESSLGLRTGTNVALTRTSSGIEIVNLDYVRGLLGQAQVRAVDAAGGTITIANRTGTHTIAVAKSVIRHLHLHRGMQVLVSQQGSAQLQISALAQTSR
jgi:hypothetical protein